MCTSLFAFGIHARLLFLLAFNRDEFLERPTEPAHWWEDEPEILGGRDGLKKGTWLAFTRAGKFAFLTNFREPAFNKVEEGEGRGYLPLAFLKGHDSPMAYLRKIDVEAYNGFNLVVGDLVRGEVAYLTNRGSSQEAVELAPNLYGISNGVLLDQWPKVVKAKIMITDILGSSLMQKEEFPWENVFNEVLYQCDKVQDPTALPQTGMPEKVEREFSSIFINRNTVLGREYGTRCQTLVAVWDDGTVQYKERTQFWPGDGEKAEAKTSEFEYMIPITNRWSNGSKTDECSSEHLN